MFGGVKENVTSQTLESYEPVEVIKALVEAKSSFALSTKAKQTIMNILKSIETL
jgi:ribosome maturation protein Sdo1